MTAEPPSLLRDPPPLASAHSRRRLSTAIRLHLTFNRRGNRMLRRRHRHGLRLSLDATVQSRGRTLTMTRTIKAR
jgi:hypothetical protein